ncbi:glutaredoxin family protein [Marinobacterium sediminicola]|uniref:Glutaredoxin-like domain n=1 Tax=Marinobacterium sediminicola TaxID=518898 RepID=A0ABY1RVR2_9GAMM|nr:glutaredoxin family protein [Marinobacterium sediminicola]ULG70597.1 glutaredoxin family protein [Marinobacterium sediminicola]SMR68912.1 Glutaredoxin-like domain [Marinobacterium sediminicola]
MLYLDLMTTEGCHLCEDAIAVLQQVLVAGQAEVDLVDIVYEPKLMELYAERIPVLVDRGTGQELGWPFEAQQLRQFIDALPHC